MRLIDADALIDALEAKAAFNPSGDLNISDIIETVEQDNPRERIVTALNDACWKAEPALEVVQLQAAIAIVEQELAGLEPVESVFEVRDITDDEVYYTVGVYSTLELALASLDVEEPPETNNTAVWYGVLTFSIKHRPLNQYSETGKEVASVTWTRLPLDDNDEDYKWDRKVAITNDAQGVEE